MRVSVPSSSLPSLVPSEWSIQGDVMAMAKGVGFATPRGLDDAILLAACAEQGTF